MWVIFVTPLWIFLITREIIGYSGRAVIQTLRGDALPTLSDLDKIANLYPSEFHNVYQIAFGVGGRFEVGYPRPGILRLIFDSFLTLLAAYWLAFPEALAFVGTAISWVGNTILTALFGAS